MILFRTTLYGADEEPRTLTNEITSFGLYQLSYISMIINLYIYYNTIFIKSQYILRKIIKKYCFKNLFKNCKNLPSQNPYL